MVRLKALVRRLRRPRLRPMHIGSLSRHLQRDIGWPPVDDFP